MKRFTALALAATLGACAFWSEEALFDERGAARPIADGSRFLWIEDGGEPDRVVYRRAGAGYQAAAIDAEDEPLHVLFFSVSETSEEDYVVEVAVRPDEPARFYAYMWRTAEGYRLVSAPRVLEEDPRGQQALARLCGARPSGECRLDRAEDVLALYRDAIHPAFVVAGATPNDYVDQIEMAAELEAQ